MRDQVDKSRLANGLADPAPRWWRDEGGGQVLLLARDNTLYRAFIRARRQVGLDGARTTARSSITGVDRAPSVRKRGASKPPVRAHTVDGKDHEIEARGAILHDRSVAMARVFEEDRGWLVRRPYSW
ncbi:hypothetical protein [Micromonospora avicenniae]|uniref:hypothetical protein n=1 Tax=Micromonospora avicenniae TaxID=1198245 RepID=UPI00331664C1